jgi:phosphonate transport system permease protein
MWPMVIAERTSVERIDDFDPDNLPFLSYLETEEKVMKNYNPDTLQLEEKSVTSEVLVEPFGYLIHVCKKMLQSLEIALWGTIVAIVVSIPLAYSSARNYTPNRFGYHVSRASVSFLRAIPELISALFLVLAFGFGPIAGVLALGLHCAGFLGKFYAEDIENADKAPQEALMAINAGKVKTLWYAVIPQVFPQYVAYTLYILDRNVRMATVVGIVGAGGIGMELKGRFDMFNYGHVTTILLVLFLTVFVLDQIAAGIRSKLI